MFQPAFGIFSCKNAYDCIEAFLLSTLSALTLILFIRAYKLIRKDQAQILDQTDKTIFYIASGHSLLLSFMLIIFTNPFFTYTTRALYLILDIIICSVVAEIYFSTEVHPRIRKVMIFMLSWTVILWLVSIIDPTDYALENECRLLNTLLFSISTTSVSIVLLFCGYGAVDIINAVERRQSIYSTGSQQDLWQIRRFQELRERKVQLMTLTGVNIIASFVQLVWDIKKYDTNFTQDQCDRLTFAYNFTDLVAFTIMEILCNLLPFWGIYYIYYWRNREHFRSDNQNFGRHYNDFDDLRSDMIDI